MTQLDVIRMIGDRLTEIDVAVGSLMPGDPSLQKLQDLRQLLDARQLVLSRALIDDSTARFRDAADRLRAINVETSGTLQEIDDMVVMIENVARFLDAVTTFMTAVTRPA